MILNFATFLEENKYWEEAFRVYEKGVATFGFPHAKPIWTRYLDNFVQRCAALRPAYHLTLDFPFHGPHIADCSPITSPLSLSG